MEGLLSVRERAFRVVIGVVLAFVAYHVGLTSSGTEPLILAWGALALAVTALATAALGAAGAALSGVGLDSEWSIGYLTARLYVGWEFLYAGWDKAAASWFNGAGAGAVKGTLTGAIAGSHASAQDPRPAVANWFGWVSQHVFLSHAEFLSYLIVVGEICVGIGLIAGLFLRLSAFFGVALNSLFLFAGALGAGLNPEMILLGMGVLLASSAGVYALSVDRYLWPKVRGLRLDLAPARTHHPQPR